MSDLQMADEVAAVFIMANAFTEHSKEVTDEISSYKNVFITTNEMGLGFAEVIYTLLGF
jgi:hypothetical protein